MIKIEKSHQEVLEQGMLRLLYFTSSDFSRQLKRFEIFMVECLSFFFWGQHL